jgi:hypothetical protein
LRAQKLKKDLKQIVIMVEKKQIYEKEITFQNQNLKYWYLDILEWIRKNSKHIELLQYEYYTYINFMYFFPNRTGEYGMYEALNHDRPLFNLTFSTNEEKTKIKIVIKYATSSKNDEIKKYLGVIGLLMEYYKIPLNPDEKQLYFNKDWKINESMGWTVP